MKSPDFEWLAFAAHIDGPGFARFQRALTRYNRRRLIAVLPDPAWRAHVRAEARVVEAEGEFMEAMRQEIAPLVADIPQRGRRFHRLVRAIARDRARPGRSAVSLARRDRHARADEMVSDQEVAGEAGFDDLLALTQIKMPVAGQARNGAQFLGRDGPRPRSKGMHGPMLERLGAAISNAIRRRKPSCRRRSRSATR